MYGAILGDIIGSTREWDRIKTKDFELFEDTSEFTDDTVMTIATADAILNGKTFGMAYYDWGRKYPGRGYGARFNQWLKSKNPEPYYSFGNGSAMRVSPIGWITNDMDKILKLAQDTAYPTHNHPEGIKGAEAIAAAILLSRQGKTKNEIKDYIEFNFKYNLSRKLEDVRPYYRFDETCQGSVPESIICFLESDSFEDTIRNAVSLGGDADTQACIAGSIAEAFYGVPDEYKNLMSKYLPEEMINILDQFSKTYMVKYI